MKPFLRTLVLLPAAGTLAVVLTPVAASAQEAPAEQAPSQENGDHPAGRCDEGHWPRSVQGQPRAFKAGGTAGYYIWHDDRGWHLRTTTPRRTEHVFEGTIASADDIQLVHQYRDERGDEVKVEGNTLAFKFVTSNGVDGVDFTVGCTESIDFALHGQGRPTTPRRIWLGKTGKAPSNPFTVSRVA